MHVHYEITIMVVDKKELSRKVKRLSEGILSKTVDMMLVSIYFGLEASFSGYSKTGLAGEKAITDLSEFNLIPICKVISDLFLGKSFPFH